MKNQLLNLKMIALMCLMMVLGGAKVWAQETTVTSTFTNNKLAVGKGEPTWKASISSTGFESSDNKRGVQFGKNKGKFTITSYSEFTNVTKVSIVCSANSSSNTIAVAVGGSTLGSTVTMRKANNQTCKFEGKPCSGSIVINCNDNSSSLWIKSISITYSEKPSSPSSELTLSQTAGSVEVGKTIDLSQYVSTVSGYDGTINYEVTDGAEFISIAGGVVTGVSEGNASIKVTATEVADKFSESSQIFKLTVLDSRIATNVSFGADVDNSIITVLDGEESSFNSPKASLTPDNIGIMKYSSSQPTLIDVNEKTGEVEFKAFGTVVINATFDGNDEYKNSIASYTLVYKANSIIFNDANGSYEKMPTNGYVATEANQELDFILTDISKQEYTFKGHDFYKNNNGIQLRKNTGYFVSPTFSFENGYNVTVTTSTNDVNLSCGSKIVEGKNKKVSLDILDPTATFKIYTGTKYAVVSQIEITPLKASKSKTIDFKATDGSSYYATFSSDKGVVFTNDVTVYGVSVDGGKISTNAFTPDLYEVTDATAGEGGYLDLAYYVPANTGVLLECKNATATYYFFKEGDGEVTLTANQLMPAPANGGVFEATDGYKYYKLAYDNFDDKTGLGFYWGAPEGGKFFVKAGTAYLAVSKANTAGAKGFTLNGEATGIEGVNANVENAKAIYNLNGQRVASMAKPGLYIVNGKKMVVKK